MPTRTLKSTTLALLASCLALAPALAQAQTLQPPTPSTAIVITFTDTLQTARMSTPGVITLSGPDCAANFAIGFTFTIPQAISGGTESESLYLAQNSSCSNVNSTDVWWELPGVPPMTPVSSLAGNTMTQGLGQYLATMGFTAQNIFQFAKQMPVNNSTLNLMTACPAASSPANQSVFLCAEITSSPGNLSQVGSFQFQVNTQAPVAPESVAISPLNNGLDVSWTMPTNAQLPLNFQVVATGPDNIPHKSTLLTGVTTYTNNVKLTGLTNGTNYSVVVNVLDNSGIQVDYSDANVASSAAQTGTPQAALDFLQAYANQGGQGQGCASGGASMLAVLGLGVLLFRRRRVMLGAAMAPALLVGSNARAAAPAPEDIETAPPPVQRISSPRNFALQLSLGGFAPNVDSASGLNGAHPYKDYFGTGRPLLTQVELDYDLFSRFGRLELGASFGFWQAVGKARVPTDYNTKALDTETLNLYPLSLLLVYRADFIYEKASIPLVPYVKVGYGFTHFSDNTDGSTQKVTYTNGVTASSQGWAGGFQYAAGLQLVLDFIDPRSAASLDTDFGINSTSLYAEYGQSYWTGFKAGGPPFGGYWISGGFLVAF